MCNILCEEKWWRKRNDKNQIWWDSWIIFFFFLQNLVFDWDFYETKNKNLTKFSTSKVLVFLILFLKFSFSNLFLFFLYYNFFPSTTSNNVSAIIRGCGNKYALDRLQGFLTLATYKLETSNFYGNIVAFLFGKKLGNMLHHLVERVERKNMNLNLNLKRFEIIHIYCRMELLWISIAWVWVLNAENFILFREFKRKSKSNKSWCFVMLCCVQLEKVWNSLMTHL